MTIGANERWNRRPGFRETLLYNATLRPYGIGAGLDLVLRIGGRARGILFVNRKPRLSRFSNEEQRLLLDIAPHFRRALDLPAHDVAARATTSEDVGIVLARPDGRTVFASENAPKLIHQLGCPRIDEIDRQPYWRHVVDTLVARVGTDGSAMPPRFEQRGAWGTFVINALPQAHAGGASTDLVGLTIERLVPPDVDILRRLRRTVLTTRASGCFRTGHL